MRTVWIGLGLVGMLLVGASPASAQPCTTGVQEFCDAVDGLGFARLFGDYSDLGALFLGLLLVIALLTGILAFLRRARVRPRVRAEARAEHVDVGPGGSIQLLADVENPRKHTSIDVVAEWDELPPEWSAAAFAAVAYAGGFTSPQVVSREEPVHLSSRDRGHNRATVALQLTAPEAISFDENLEVELRLVPVTAGVPRRNRSARIKYDVRLTTRTPSVEIQDVSHEPASLVAGQPVRTLARLFNQGDAEARDVGVHLSLNDQPLEQKVVPVVGARQDADVEFTWTPLSGENRVRISLA